MPYSVVERDAFRYRHDDDCPRLTGGLHAIKGHCQHCDNLIRASKPKPYRVWDHNGNVITADSVDML